MSILEFAAILALCGYSVYRQTKTNDVFGHHRRIRDGFARGRGG